MVPNGPIRRYIASPPDRNNLVIELFAGDEQWGEISKEQDEMLIELYPKRDKGPWVLNLDEVLRFLADGRRDLLDRVG